MGLEREESCQEEGKETGLGAKWGEAICDGFFDGRLPFNGKEACDCKNQTV